MRDIDGILMEVFIPDPLTGKLGKAEIEEHLAQGEKFDSYFKPPANLPTANGTQIAFPGLEIPLWSSPARAEHDAGTLHVFSMDIPDEMRRNKVSNAPAKIQGKNPYIAISASSFYRLSLLCQTIDNWTPPRDELSGPIPFDIFIPRIKPHSLKSGKIPVFLEKSACRDENNPCLTLSVLKSEILVDSNSSVQTIGTLATVEYDGRSLIDNERIHKWLRRIGGKNPLDVSIIRRPEFMERPTFSAPESLRGFLPLPRSIAQLKSD